MFEPEPLTVAKIEALRRRYMSHFRLFALSAEDASRLFATFDVMREALEACRAQLDFRDHEVGWRLRLKEQIDEALEGGRP